MGYEIKFRVSGSDGAVAEKLKLKCPSQVNLIAVGRERNNLSTPNRLPSSPSSDCPSITLPLLWPVQDKGHWCDESPPIRQRNGRLTQTSLGQGPPEEGCNRRHSALTPVNPSTASSPATHPVIVSRTREPSSSTHHHRTEPEVQQQKQEANGPLTQPPREDN